MRIVEINIPFRDPTDPKRWITVPPEGYGGIQSALASLIDGFLELGQEVSLLGAPGSCWRHGAVEVIDAAEVRDMNRWLHSATFDAVHDHTCACHLRYGTETRDKVWLVYHLSGSPDTRYASHRNIITLSEAQQRSANLPWSRVIRLPVNPNRFDFSQQKRSYLLFLGRVSPWKGVKEACRFAELAGMKLVIAGPRWEPQYYSDLVACHGSLIEYVGEVGGDRKRRLLAEAHATLVLSQPLPDQNGRMFWEPGSAVVSESAVSGTPVISSANGCLPEIVPSVGCVLEDAPDVDRDTVLRALDSLPSPAAVREHAIAQWGHTRIAEQYLGLSRPAAPARPEGRGGMPHAFGDETI
jgi:glycosyltransferase involved in cell wall biosynthesis